MADQHPITPPLKLRRLWARQAQRMHFCDSVAWLEHIATQSARWGYEQRGAVNEEKLQKARDEGLEACLEEIRDGAGRAYIDESKLRVRLADDIWTARRPKPKSQAEQALDLLDRAEWNAMAENLGNEKMFGIDEIGLIRRALKRLQELEAIDG